MKRKTSEPKVSKLIPLWKNYHGEGYIEPQEVITLKDAIEYAKLLLTIVIVSGFGVDGSIDAIIYASNKASFKAVKVK